MCDGSEMQVVCVLPQHEGMGCTWHGMAWPHCRNLAGHRARRMAHGLLWFDLRRWWMRFTTKRLLPPWASPIVARWGTDGVNSRGAWAPSQ